MESHGAVEIWGRSEEKHGAHYIEFIGDGDCSSYRDVVKSKPYGDNVTVDKIECVGHIQKRMGGRLRKIKRDWKGKKLSDGKTIGGRNRLTDNLIDTFQRYYGNALRKTKGNLPGMQKAVKAIWHHYASTKENPQHDHCPTGPTSWCKWQKDQVSNTNTFEPKKVDASVMNQIKPVFEALGDSQILEKVLKGYSQNPNESLNHIVWDICPKEVFSGPETVETACSLAVLLFNSGAETLGQVLQGLHLTVGEHCKAGFKTINQQRLFASAQKASDEEKHNRQIRRTQRKKKNRQG